MSSDNGIYILETPKGDKKEYRVKHLLAIDNLDYDSEHHCITLNDSVRIKNAREMWEGTGVYENKAAALSAASKLLDKIVIVEYGICLIEIDKEF